MSDKEITAIEFLLALKNRLKIINGNFNKPIEELSLGQLQHYYDKAQRLFVAIEEEVSEFFGDETINSHWERL